MYYLRTKSAVDAIKFTLDNKKTEALKPETATVEAVADTAIVETAVLEKQQEKAAKTAAKFSKESAVEVEPMSAEEMKALIAQAKEAEGDDCLMCGS